MVYSVVRFLAGHFASPINGGNVMNTSEVIDTISVCQCCMLVQANGECGDDCHDVEPLSLINAPYSVTLGIMDDAHSEFCSEDDRESGACECEHLGFSWRSCEGCGSGLGGDRFALTLWRDWVGSGLPGARVTG